MTVAQKIKSRIDMLELSQQTTLLKMIESFESTSKHVPAKKRRANVSEVDAAITEAAGIWKTRTDLPKNSVAASRLLRRNLMRQGGNA